MLNKAVANRVRLKRLNGITIGVWNVYRLPIAQIPMNQNVKKVQIHVSRVLKIRFGTEKNVKRGVKQIIIVIQMNIAKQKKVPAVMIVRNSVPLDTGKVKLYVSEISMNHNTGLRFCEVLGRKLNITGMTMASVADFECADPIDFSAEKQVDCCHKVSIGRPDVCGYQVSAISDVAHHFAQKFPWDDYWLIESYTNKYICAKANLYTGENPLIPEWSNFDSYTPALKYELRVICK